MKIIRFERAKLKELILYIATKSEDDQKFGSIKLNKLLYYCDFEAYRRFGQAITGADYQHIAEGPAPRALLPIKNEMLANGDAHETAVPYFGRRQIRLIADRTPDMEAFIRDEISLVDEMINRYWNYSGMEITDESHMELGWRLTEDGETIPYSSAWFSPAPLTMSEIETGREIAKEHGLLAEPL